MNTMRHAQHNIVVTGGGQGIGRAYAHRLSSEGAQLIIADINEQAGQNVVAEIREKGGRACFRLLDVSDSTSCAEFADFMSSKFKTLHGLINNAAIFSSIVMKPFWEITRSEWDTMMAVNLRGPFLVTKELLEPLKEANGASVVNISSDSLWLGRAGYLHYTTSKAGIIGMTYSMAKELGSYNIRVNAVSPGPVYTEIPRDTVSSEQKAAIRSAQALHRDASPEDIVGLVSYLLGGDSEFISGQVISVNGGLIHR